jgi:hypothetical protein
MVGTGEVIVMAAIAVTGGPKPFWIPQAVHPGPVTVIPAGGAAGEPRAAPSQKNALAPRTATQGAAGPRTQRARLVAGAGSPSGGAATHDVSANLAGARLHGASARHRHRRAPHASRGG